jgi:ZIP family zinc transporter
VGEALLFGAVASSGLVLGAVVGVGLRLPERVLALLLAFASGALITALSFDLFEDAYEKSDPWTAGAAFLAGAIAFVAVDSWLDRRIGGGDGRGPATRVAGWALLAAVTLDGVPENLALGVTLAEGVGSLALLLAIFASNFPEAVVGSAAMQESGHSGGTAVAIWCATAVILAASVVAGAAFIPESRGAAASIPLAFAAGAVIASLADTLMPEAFKGGGPSVALATTVGFLTSFLLSTA